MTAQENPVDPLFRRPKQERGRIRFESLLDAAHEIVGENGSPDGLSLYDIAKRAEVTSGACYHFFPSAEAICAALITRYNQEIMELLLMPPPEKDTATLESMVQHKVKTLADYMNNNRPAMIIFAQFSHNKDIANIEYASREKTNVDFANHFSTYFDLPELSITQKVMFHMNEIIICLLMVSYRLYEKITDEYILEASRAASAYIELYAGKYPKKKSLSHE